MDTDQGLKPALAASIAEAGPGPRPPPEQLDLLGMPSIRTSDGRESVPVPRGPGRPAGAQNAATKRWRSYLLSRYTSPLETLAATAALSVDEIARSLGCSRLEAFDRKIDCAKAAVAFLFPRLQATLYRNEGDPAGGAASRLVLTAQDDEAAVVDLVPDYPPPDREKPAIPWDDR